MQQYSYTCGKNSTDSAMIIDAMDILYSGTVDGFCIDLLPSLPSAWPSGSYSGLRARGGHEVSCTWDDGKVTGATVTSSSAGVCTLRSRNPLKPADRATERALLSSAESEGWYVLEFRTLEGASFRFE